jgi:predicted outer membrane repeat protein
MGIVCLLARFPGRPTGVRSAHAETSTLFAEPGGMVTGDCEDWVHACDLNYALAITSDNTTEIWVKEGSYQPTPGTDRSASFQLTNGLAMYGGFTGTETNREERDWLAHPTNLSGDLGVPVDSSDNAYHVILSISVDQTALIDGFTITGGNSDGDKADFNGGGLYAENSYLSLSNLIILENNAAYSGGGLYASNSHLTLDNVTFKGNSAVFGGGLKVEDSSSSFQTVTFNQNYASNQGGGIYAESSDFEMNDVTFNENTGTYEGGGISLDWGTQTMVGMTFTDNLGGGISCGYCNLTLNDATFEGNSDDSGAGLDIWSSDPILTHVSFINNIAGYSGGGMRADSASHPQLVDVSFTDNQADYYGGGMYNEDDSIPTLLRVTFSGNQAVYGGGLYADNADGLYLVNSIFKGNSSDSEGGGMYLENSDASLANVIFSGNSAGSLGGGIYNRYSNPRLVNATFSSNTASFGGGMGNDYSNPYVANGIFWGNAATMGAQIYDRFESNTLTVFSLVQDGYPGTRILTEDPSFIDADGPDDIYGTLDDDLHLLETSPAIDAGDNLSIPADNLDLDGDGDTGEQLPYDLDGMRRRIDVSTMVDKGNGSVPIVDLGAYETLLVRYKVYLPLMNR